MPVLTDAELRTVAEVVSELAKLRGTSFDKAATGFTFARAALRRLLGTARGNARLRWFG